MIHAAESMHWYARDGSPQYTVKAKDGTDRPATLRDARKLGLVPSVTSIIGCCAKPGLERWKLDQMMHAALTLPRIDGEPESDWINRVWADSKETAKKASERGTAIHAAIQGYLQNERYDKALEKHVIGACEELDSAIGLEWDCCGVEKSFAHCMGFGGKTDLFCTSPELIVDFKTKEFGEDADLKTWDEHAMQLAAYRYGFGLPRARGAICYVSVTVPGLARVIEIEQKDLAKGWRMFCGLLDYWKAKCGYEPGWTVSLEEAAGMVA